MLANLYRKAGQERSAVTSYKEVLRQCPLALDAIIGMHRYSRAQARLYVNDISSLVRMIKIILIGCKHTTTRSSFYSFFFFSLITLLKRNAILLSATWRNTCGQILRQQLEHTSCVSSTRFQIQTKLLMLKSWKVAVWISCRTFVYNPEQLKEQKKQQVLNSKIVKWIDWNVSECGVVPFLFIFKTLILVVRLLNFSWQIFNIFSNALLLEVCSFVVLSKGIVSLCLNTVW